MICFRTCDSRIPFFWSVQSGPQQRSARWHSQGEGPVQYLADTPNGAWAELLRHEEIHDAEDLQGLAATLWAIDVELPDPVGVTPRLPIETLQGGRESYGDCQRAARALRRGGAQAMTAPSAALLPGGASGSLGTDQMQRARPRDGRVIVIFGAAPQAVGWRTASPGGPPADLLDQVRHFIAPASAAGVAAGVA